MKRRATHGIEQITAGLPGKQAEGHRRIGRAERGEPDFRHAAPGNLRHDAQGVEVGGLALIGRHPCGGVALHMLDGAEPFARRDAQVPGGDIVLEIDKGLHRIR